MRIAPILLLALALGCAQRGPAPAAASATSAPDAPAAISPEQAAASAICRLTADGGAERGPQYVGLSCLEYWQRVVTAASTTNNATLLFCVVFDRTCGLSPVRPKGGKS